ncbi:bar domain protein [Lichtheimia corymbifera JMRC:FSU:9682]|uniref:Bar domain protein n=1 Tax=Lichtheimia corymbifera JMRC:FSU:9682 TaxID=1263082 RepID=A0A068S1A5_9FUNG|nr:bar domain protein [Lichtheimia corymbifera JMRC:FSU:9682]
MTPVSNQVEPQQVHAKAIDNNGIDDKTTVTTTTTTTTTTPFAQKLSKGFGLVRQSPSLRRNDLEKRMDTLRQAQMQLLKVSRIYGQPAYDCPTQHFDELSNALKGIDGHMDYERPKSLPHALARVAAQGSEIITCNNDSSGGGDVDPLANALHQVATTYEKIGDARIEMDKSITCHYHQPMLNKLQSTFDQAIKARRHVQSTRLSLDASRAQYRSASADRKDIMRRHCEQAEEQFVSAVLHATNLMKEVLLDPEPFKGLTELVIAQAAFYKEAHERLLQLAPELDEILVLQESQYRKTRG